MSLSKEEIFEAANLIHATGAKVTYEAIREKVGGSYTTIGKAMKEWEPPKEKAGKEPAPEPIAAALANLGADIWALALVAANESLAKERAAMNESLAAMQARHDEITDLMDRLEADLEAERAKGADLAKAWESERQALIAARDAVAPKARAASKKSS